MKSNSWASIRARLQALGHAGDGLPLGIGHDSPEITPPEHLRFDAGWTINEPLPPECGLGRQTVPGGTYAVTTYVGPFSQLGLAYAEIGARIMRHADRLAMGAGDFRGSVEWYRTGSIDDDLYLNQVDIAFPITARAGGSRVLE
jgi:DNA gyrase inhibitor GyrI